MTEVPGFLAPDAEGHRGTIASYDMGGVPTLVLAAVRTCTRATASDPSSTASAQPRRPAARTRC